MTPQKLKALIFSQRAQKVFSAIVSRGVSTIASFALIYAASKLLSTEDYGFYLFIFTVGSALGMIISGSVPLSLLKHLRGPDNDQKETNDWLLSKMAGLQLKWLLAAALGLLALGLFNPPQLNNQPLIVIPLFAFVLAFAIGENLLSYFRVRQDVLWALLPRENIWRICAALTLSAMAIIGVKTSGYEVFTIVAAILALCIFVQFAAFISKQGAQWLKNPAKPADAPIIDKSEVQYFSAHTFLNAMAMHFETLVVGVIIGLEAAAFYFVAKRLTQLLLLPTLAIDTLGVPLIAEKIQKKDTIGAQKIISYCSLGSFCLCLIGAVFLFFAGPFILGLFKPEFIEHFDVVIVLILAALVNAWFGPGSNVLMVADGEKFFFWMRSATAITAAIGIVIFGYFFGMMGVALSSLALGALEEFWVNAWARKRLGLNLMASAFLNSSKQV